MLLDDPVNGSAEGDKGTVVLLLFTIRMFMEYLQEAGTYPPCKVPLTAEVVPEGIELGVAVPADVGLAVLEPASWTLEGIVAARLSDDVPVDSAIVVV